MKAKSKAQFKYIQHLRGKYKSQKKAPKKYKWAFKRENTKVRYKNLPEKVKESVLDYFVRKSKQMHLIEEIATDTSSIIATIEFAKSNTGTPLFEIKIGNEFHIKTTNDVEAKFILQLSNVGMLIRHILLNEKLKDEIKIYYCLLHTILNSKVNLTINANAKEYLDYLKLYNKNFIEVLNYMDERNNIADITIAIKNYNTIQTNIKNFLDYLSKKRKTYKTEEMFLNTIFLPDVVTSINNFLNKAINSTENLIYRNIDTTELDKYLKDKEEEKKKENKKFAREIEGITSEAVRKRVQEE